jgi:ribosomal protein S18 acetylase RimI-like enzyme
MRTAAAWTNAAMLHWLDSMGFELATSLIVDCAVDGGSYLAQRDDAIDELPGDAVREIDFSAAPENDYERLARDSADVRAMGEADLGDIVRIDRAITHRDRRTYMQAKLGEALDDSGLRVSLVARRDGVNVGYLMAQVDRGDFGRTDPVAIIDTLGVEPDYARHGIGRALLSQLFANLGALRVERVETIVPVRDLPLLGFLLAVGFAPAQRLPFVHHLQ